MNLPGHPVDSVRPSLTVQRLGCQISLPFGGEQPAAARDRIARIAERDLAGVCAEVLASLPEDGDAIYRIRHLHMELWVDLQGMSEADIARRWGRLLAGNVVRAMRKGGPGEVMRFESARHFVASFLRDVIDGRAWHRWYYDEFKFLERLSPQQLAVQLLASRPTWIAPTLLDLMVSGHGDRLIERWETGDIDTLWQALGLATTPEPTHSLPADLLDRLLAAWRSATLSGGADGNARTRDRLRVWLALASHDRSRAQDAIAGGLIPVLVDLAALLRIEPELAPVLLMESEPYPALLRRLATGPGAFAVGWLPGWTAQEGGRSALRQLVEIIQTRLDSQPAGLSSQQTEGTKGRRRGLDALALTSPIGSVFLLAPALVETGLWQRWLDKQSEDIARRYLFIVALKAFGRERAPLHLGDRLLAAFAGLETAPLADLRLSPDADEFPGEWVHSLPSIAARWHPAHERQLLAAVVAGIEVLRDRAARCWLAARPQRAADARSSLSHWPSMDIDPSLVQLELSEDELEQVRAEARYLQLGQNLGFPWLTPSLDAALSAVTSLVLRRTATRLPRFDQASPAYLARQFLAQPATLRTDHDAWTVQLSGGPLAVVLRLASLPETIDVPWLPLPLRLTFPSRM